MVGKSGYDIVYGFERELNKIQAYGELSDAERKRVEDNAREIARLGLAGAKDAVELQRRFVQAGRSVDEAIGMSKPTLDFSLFGDVDPAKAANVITTIAAAYRKQMDAMEPSEVAGRIGDVLAKGANISLADVSDFAEGFKYVAPLASKAGMSIEQVTAAIATMNQHGLKGNEAGVALRSMLVRMVKPTANARAAMEGYGLSFEQFVNKWQKFDGNALQGVLNLNGINVKKPLMDKVSSAVKDMDPQKDAKAIRETVTKILVDGMDLKPRDGKVVAKTISNFLGNMAEGVDADAMIRALEDKNVSLGAIANLFDVRQGARLSTLFNGEMYQQMLDKVNDKSTKGASARGAETMLKGLIGASMRLKGAWDNLWISIARSGVLDSVTNMLTRIANLINNMGKSNPAGLRFLTEAAIGAALLGPALMIIGTAGRIAAGGLKLVLGAAALLLSPFGKLIGIMLGIPAAIRTATAALALFAARMRIVAGAMVALGAARTAMVGFWAAVAGGAAVLPMLARGLGTLLLFSGIGTAIAAVTVALGALGVWIYNNWSGVKNFLGGFGEGLMAGLGPAGDKIRDIGTALGGVFDWLKKLTGEMNLTTEQWREWGGAVGFAAADGINKVVSAIKTVIEVLGAAIDKAVAFGGALRSALAGDGGGGAANIKTGTPGARVFGKRAAPAGARALGGPVTFGKSYLVGERGPELFTPGASGRIDTNGALNKLTDSGTAAAAASNTSVSRSQSAQISVRVEGGGNAQDIADEVERGVYRVFAKLESDQRGLLSD
jgi:hypothetical protein